MKREFNKYIIWLVITLFVTYAFCLNTASAAFAPIIQASLHLGEIGLSVASGAFTLGYACMQIPAGYLLDKYNPRWVVSIGLLLLVIGNFAVSFTSTLIPFTLWSILQGIGAAFAFVSAAVLIAQWFSTTQFPILFGFTQTISCLAAGIVHYSFTKSLQAHSWNSVYQVIALIGLVLFLLTLLFIKSPPSMGPKNQINLKRSISIVGTNVNLIFCAIATATSFGILLTYAGFWYLPVQEFYHLDQVDAVIISGFIFLGIGLGTPFWAWLSNKIGSRTLVIHVSLVIGTMLMLLCLYLPHFDFKSLILIKSLSFLMGFFISGSTLFYTIASEISSYETRGVAISFINSTDYLFNILMLFIPYFFLTNFSKYYYTYLWVLPFCLLIALLMNYFIKDSYKSESGESSSS